MNCMYCKGEMQKKTAYYNIDRKGYHLLLDAIPAWVCDQCGEAYFEENEVDSIQNVIRAVDREASSLLRSA